jgi:hypothetical protein
VSVLRQGGQRVSDEAHSRLAGGPDEQCLDDDEAGPVQGPRGPRRVDGERDRAEQDRDEQAEDGGVPAKEELPVRVDDLRLVRDSLVEPVEEPALLSAARRKWAEAV